MFKCKKCGYKTSFKNLMIRHMSDTHSSSVVNRYSDSSTIDTLIDFDEIELTSESYSSLTDDFSGGGGSFGGGGASGSWDD